ncbi:MAG: AMIN domain-containing protein [Desulfobulbaceae bacterium]|nr:AMIN domain-containing protein [Desulfobulbaceae bacterium]
MKKYLSLGQFLFIPFLLLAGLCSASSGQVLEKIEFDASTPGIDLVTFKMNGAHLPTSFALKGDLPRVIFDFPDVEPSKNVKNIMATDGRFIKQIRTGIHSGENPKTRVVFDLRSDGAVDFKQDFDAATNTLRISLFTAGFEPPSAGSLSWKPSPESGETPAAAPAMTATQPAEGTAGPAPAAESSSGTAGMPGEQTAPEPPGQPDAPETLGDHLFAAIPESETEDILPEETTRIQPLAEIGNQKALPGNGGQPTLYSIEFDQTSDRGEMILFKLSNFNPPVVFGIEEDIPRIVCFFKDTGAGEDLVELIESNGRFVRNIRVGKYRNPDNVRVVLDLVPNHNYDLQQVFFKEDDMFMIIINTAGEHGAGKS